jgi:hypothetical protein
MTTEHRKMTTEEFDQFKETYMLPVWLEERIEQGILEGISYKLAIPLERPIRVTEIHWRPGDRNALVDAILRKVTEPGQEMLLELNGVKYTLTKLPVTDLLPSVRRMATRSDSGRERSGAYLTGVGGRLQPGRG